MFPFGYVSQDSDSVTLHMVKKKYKALHTGLKKQRNNNMANLSPLKPAKKGCRKQAMLLPVLAPV